MTPARRPLLAGRAGLLLALAIPGAASGQNPAAPGSEPKPEALVFLRHTPELSLKAFMACDQDGDDRLTFREARASLGIQSPEAFQLWDSDRDGLIHFPEFDRAFQERIRAGRDLILFGAAARRSPRPEPPVPPLLAELFRSMDQDEDGAIQLREWQRPPESLAPFVEKVTGGFFILDRNRDGRLMLAELRPLAVLLPAVQGPQAEGPDLRSLPLPLRTADRDGDQSLSLSEVEGLLRRVDPALALWAERVFATLDRNGDGKVVPAELQARLQSQPGR